MSISSERRRFHRFGFEAQALLRIGPRARMSCALLDLSLNGALIQLDEAPSLGDSREPSNLWLVLRGLVRGDIVTMSMEIEPVRIEGTHMGCRIVNIDAESFSSLKSLIEDNLGDVNLLYRELTQLDYWPGTRRKDE